MVNPEAGMQKDEMSLEAWNISLCQKAKKDSKKEEISEDNKSQLDKLQETWASKPIIVKVSILFFFSVSKSFAEEIKIPDDSLLSIQT